MIAADFKERNLMLAEDQPEYETLPVYCEYREIIIHDNTNHSQLATVTKIIP